MKLMSFLTASGAVLFASVAQAALIAPSVNAFALAEPGPVGGAVVANLAFPFAAATYSGVLTSQVISGDASNPLGGLTFTYSITTDATNTHNISRFAVNGYTGFLTDMSYTPGTGTIAATLNDRDASGDVIGYRYVGAPIGLGTIGPGATTNLMVVQTNATNWDENIAIVINGSVTSVNALAPALIPEPTSATALLALAGLARRRR
jgi:hypothetical protein